MTYAISMMSQLRMISPFSKYVVKCAKLSKRNPTRLADARGTKMDAITKDELAEAVKHINAARAILLRAASATLRGLSDDLKHTEATLLELLRYW